MIKIGAYLINSNPTSFWRFLFFFLKKPIAAYCLCKVICNSWPARRNLMDCRLKFAEKNKKNPLNADFLSFEFSGAVSRRPNVITQGFLKRFPEFLIQFLVWDIGSDRALVPPSADSLPQQRLAVIANPAITAKKIWQPQSSH